MVAEKPAVLYLIPGIPPVRAQPHAATRSKTQQKQDAFAAVPSRRAVFVDGLCPRTAVRALGRETALQPTSEQSARSQRRTSPPKLVALVGSNLWLVVLLQASCPLARPLALSRGFFGLGRDCGLK
jgi:hypothetical protein